MDIAAARTFLEIVKTGSFAHAAANLNFTQTAIGARVKVLEDQLGEQLFVRSRAGAELTPAGEQFLRFANSFVSLWEQARRAVSMPSGSDMTISIGADLLAYKPMLLAWIEWIRLNYPKSQILTRVESADRLINQIREGTLDAAIVYGAHAQSGLISEMLLEERLIFVRTAGPAGNSDGLDNLVGIDWGEDFRIGFNAAFPDAPQPHVSFNFGPVALDYLLQTGGTAYLRTAIASPLIEQGLLEVIPHAPQFPYSIFLVHSTRSDDGVVEIIRNGLRAISGGNQFGTQPL